MRKQKTKLNYATKYLLIACVFLLAVNLVLGIVLTSQSKKAMTTLIRDQMLVTANTAAAMLDGDLLGSITADDMKANSENFQTVLRDLHLFQDHMNMKYIYAVKHVDGKNFVFIADPDPIDPGKFGEPVVYTDALFQASQGTAAVDDHPFQDRWGSFYSAYSPVFDSAGNIAGIVCVDYESSWFEDWTAMHTFSILISCVISLLIASTLIIIGTNHLRKRIRILSEEITALSEEVDMFNKEMSQPSGASSQSKQWKPESQEEESIGPNTFEVLGDKIRQAHRDVKQYASYVRELDYTDPLTGIGNKTAFVELARDIDLKIADGIASFSILIFDVNNIKLANDEYGLAVGDQMIIDMATVLLRVFAPESIFRIGSDEFIVVTQDEANADLTRSFQKLDKELEAFNDKEKNYQITLSYAKGLASFDAEKDKTCNDAFKRASKDLSKYKSDYYRQEGDRRKQ